MKTDLKKQIIRTTCSYGDLLISRAIKSDNCWHWETLVHDSGISTRQSSLSIYNGVGGIIIFFIELFLQSNKRKYLSAAIYASNWIINEFEKEVQNFSFITGKTGIIYCLIELYKVTKNQFYIDKCIEFTKRNKQLIIVNRISTYNNGLSGSLICLLHLHRYSKNTYILDVLNEGLLILISKVRFAKKGVYWEKTGNEIKGLCGLAHGASGVGFVLLEMGYYFNNKALIWLAEEAFYYETNLFDNSKKNWPDYRKAAYTEDMLDLFKNEFNHGNLDFFMIPTDKVYWCHGAVGIGIVRLRAYELLKKKKYLKQIVAASEKTIDYLESINFDNTNCSLCHGTSGNMMYINQLSEGLNMKSLNRIRNIKHSIIIKTLHSIKIENLTNFYDDDSLFLGSSGSAYFLLKQLNFELSINILCPKIDLPLIEKIDKKYNILNISLEDLQIKLMDSAFPKTCKVIDNLVPNWRLNNLKELNNSGSHIESILFSIKKFILSCSKNEINRNIVADIFKLENAIFSVDTKIGSNALIYINEIINEQKNIQLLQLNIEEFLKYSIVLNQDVRIISTRWNWHTDLKEISNIEDLNSTSKNYSIIIARSTDTISLSINKFTIDLIKRINHKKTIANLLNEYHKYFRKVDLNSINQINVAVLQQIKFLLKLNVVKLNFFNDVAAD